jgi:hypothetical protein
VGWDGADWLMIRPLLAQGKLPNVAKLIRGGVSGELRSQEPLLSPLIWTSIATGKTVAEHGIADFLVTDPESGKMVPISSAARRVHALWTLLPAFDKSSDTVAWWATWPAEPVHGTMVTDRVAYQLIDIGAAAQDPTGKVYPDSAWPQVEDELVTAEDVGWDMMHRFVDITPQELEEHWSSLPSERREEDKVNHLRKILAATLSYQAITLSLLEHQADLTMASPATCRPGCPASARRRWRSTATPCRPTTSWPTSCSASSWTPPATTPWCCWSRTTAFSPARRGRRAIRRTSPVARRTGTVSTA